MFCNDSCNKLNSPDGQMELKMVMKIVTIAAECVAAIIWFDIAWRFVF